MTAISPIRIHKPDSCHGWGIDFNYERPFWDADATNFVVAVRQAMVTSILRSGTHVRKKKQSVWRL